MQRFSRISRLAPALLRALRTVPALALAGILTATLATVTTASDHKDKAKAAAIPKVQPPPPLNVEKVYYTQFRLMARATNRLADHRPSVPDLYFLGFAGDAGADVFLREVRAVRQLFDDQFDTRDRSVLLINNRQTVFDEPLANGHNLLAALQQIGLRMDREEDVLFLFLTSHGEQDRLAVDFRPLGLNDLRAETLKHVLEESRIKWRVIVISACHSGSFVDDLRDDNSLIITAARADRNSFGCAHENDFTYFGRAYFDRALRQTFSFSDAFRLAFDTVAQWETTEKLEPSVPQIHVGAAIRPKLQAIEARLQRRHAARSATDGPAPPSGAACCAATEGAPDRPTQGSDR